MLILVLQTDDFGVFLRTKGGSDVKIPPEHMMRVLVLSVKKAVPQVAQQLILILRDL